MGVLQGEVGGHTEKGERQYKMHSEEVTAVRDPWKIGRTYLRVVPPEGQKLGFLSTNSYLNIG